MSKLTKLALEQINTRLAADNAALRAQVSQLEADYGRLREAMAVPTAKELEARPARPAYVMPQWQAEHAANMAAAKALAMSSGKVTRV